MKKLIIGIGIISVILFAYWTLSPLFFDVIVEDTLPQTQVDNTTTDDLIPQYEASFPIQDTPAHPASGSVRIITSNSDTVVRYENYDGTNGPDLYVYLAKDIDANEFVELGRAKGNQGNINYTVPDTIDISEYSYVLTWCKAFGVLFDYVQIH